MPYKVWQVNEILTAADMNTYIGNQTILSFAGTAARATAIGTAVEGMLSYVGGGTVEVYAGTATGWTTISGGGGAGVTVGTAAPSSPAQGDLWWDSDDGKLFIYYDDGSSQQFVDAAGPSVAVQATAPTGYEGQLWLDSTDGSMYTYYTDPGGTASSWIGAVSRSGGILQVVSTTKTDVFSTSSTSYVDVTGLSVSITPRSTSSKILIVGNVSASNSASAVATYLNLVRDSTNIAQSTGGSSRNQTGHVIDAQNYVINRLPINFLDSPSTTSTVTYKIQTRCLANTAYINRRGDSTLDGAISNITVMEVAG